MKKLYEVTRPIEFDTYVFVEHTNSDRKFLFKVPEGLDIKNGDIVLCDTVHGEARGRVITDPFELEDKALLGLSKAIGCYFPVKEIKAVLILPDDMPF